MRLLVAETTDKNPSEQKENKQQQDPSTEGTEKVCAADRFCRFGSAGGQQADLLGSHEGPFNLSWAVQLLVWESTVKSVFKGSELHDCSWFIELLVFWMHRMSEET